MVAAVSHCCARQAALAGTRALIAEERFSALVALLLDCGVCSAGDVQNMLAGLAARLSAHAERETISAWQIEPGELRIEAAAIMRLALMPAPA